MQLHGGGGVNILQCIMVFFELMWRKISDDCHSLESWQIPFMKLTVPMISLSKEIPMMCITLI